MACDAGLDMTAKRLKGGELTVVVWTPTRPEGIAAPAARALALRWPAKCHLLRLELFPPRDNGGDGTCSSRQTAVESSNTLVARLLAR